MLAPRGWPWDQPASFLLDWVVNEIEQEHERSLGHKYFKETSPVIILTKRGYAYRRDRGITKATLDRIFKPWQKHGWIYFSDSPVGIVARWRNYR